jgi:hypothetical protein
MANHVSYAHEQRERAKREKLVLCTIDINGRHAKRSSVTGQAFLFTQEEIDKAYEFFQWLATKGSKAKKTKPTLSKGQP